MLTSTLQNKKIITVKLHILLAFRYHMITHNCNQINAIKNAFVLHVR